MDVITKALLKEFVHSNRLSDLPEDEQFEHFAAYCIVSSRYTEDFRTDDMVVGEGGDCGIDAYAIILNGRLVTDEQIVDDLEKMNGHLEVEFLFIQSKRTPSFDATAITTIFQNLKNVVFGENITTPRNDDIKFLIKLVKKIYGKADRFRSNPECRIYYVSTGTWVDDQYLSSIKDDQILSLRSTNLFGGVYFEPIDAQKIQSAYRRTKSKISRSIQFDKAMALPSISGVKASYLGALPASEFVKLITEDDGNIMKSVFADNVRDYQGDNPVNKEIMATIDRGQQDQFVLRNNGITVVSRELQVTGQIYTLKDYQIVNGCQTSHVLHLSRHNHKEGLLVPIKLIYTDDDDVTQEIIKSTNNQTPIDGNNLLAFTKFQRNLETYYSSFDAETKLLYERRSQQYAASSGIDRTKIITIEIQAKAYGAMFLDLAHLAGRYQSAFMESAKGRIFREHSPLEPYYTAALAYQRFVSQLGRKNSPLRDLRPFKFHFLSAFRYRYELKETKRQHPKSIRENCAHLNPILLDPAALSQALETCADIIRRAAGSHNIVLERDSAKVRELTTTIQRIASEENTNIERTPVIARVEVANPRQGLLV